MAYSEKQIKNIYEVIEGAEKMVINAGLMVNVFSKGRKITVVLTKENKTRLVGRAFCARGDTYFSDIGYCIALCRALGVGHWIPDWIFRTPTEKAENVTDSVKTYVKGKVYTAVNACPKKFDVVDKPAHYANREIEVIRYIKDNMTPEMFRGYLEGNVIKYVSRYKSKNGVEDLKKAIWYLDRLVGELSEK